jgi:hypothetical protein
MTRPFIASWEFAAIVVGNHDASVPIMLVSAAANVMLWSKDEPRKSPAPVSEAGPR